MTASTEQERATQLAKYEKNVAFLAHTATFVVMDGTGARWSREYKTARGAKAALVKMQGIK
jgi:hypothetical protein